MTDSGIPPSSRGSFRSSQSFNTMSTRVGPFTPKQVQRIHEFHNDMYMNRNIGSTLTFDYTHNMNRAMYQLTSPMSEGRKIVFTLTELRTSPNTFDYSIKCDIDDKLFSDFKVAMNVSMRDSIPEGAFQVLRAQMKELNFRVFLDMPSNDFMQGGRKLQ